MLKKRPSPTARTLYDKRRSAIARMSRFSKTTLARFRVSRTATSTMAINKPLCLIHRRIIISAVQWNRFEKMAVGADDAVGGDDGGGGAVLAVVGGGELE